MRQKARMASSLSKAIVRMIVRLNDFSYLIFEIRSSKVAAVPINTQRGSIMTKVAIVYHSGNGHTQRQAKYIRNGAASVAGTEVVFLMWKLPPGNWICSMLAMPLFSAAPLIWAMFLPA